MGYINGFELLKFMLSEEIKNNNFKKLLSTVDKEKIFRKVDEYFPDTKKYRSFFITNSPIEEENLAKLKESEKDIILNLNPNISRHTMKPDEIIGKLLALKAKYPNVPMIYNYLGNAYGINGQEKEAYDIFSETVKKFPNYIFGKTALAEYYLNTNNCKKAADVFDNKFEITQHFPPETDTFHVSEVRAFYYTVGKFFANINKIEMTYKSYFLLSEVEPDHDVTKMLGFEIIAYEVSEFTKKSSSKRRKRKK